MDAIPNYSVGEVFTFDNTVFNDIDYALKFTVASGKSNHIIPIKHHNCTNLQTHKYKNTKTMPIV